MTWPGAQEHQGLLVIANRLVDEARGLRGRLQHANDVQYAQHGDFADRARNLAEYLRAAVVLGSTDAYAPAFALVRTALEHMLVDHLVFSGQRYVRTIIGVDDETWTEWQRQRAAGERFTQVLDWSGRGTARSRSPTKDSDLRQTRVDKAISSARIIFC